MNDQYNAHYAMSRNNAVICMGWHARLTMHYSWCAPEF